MEHKPSVVNRTIQAKLDFNDSKNALLRLKYVDASEDPSSPKPFCRLTIDNNASSGTSRLILLLDIGASSTDYEQYQFSYAGVAITDPNGVATTAASTIHAVTTTDLGALIDALNAVDGITAYRLNAPADYSLNTDDFLDLASVGVGQKFYDCLYKDVSEVLTAAIRIGIPEEYDHGALKIVKIIGYANSNSDTDCVLKISTDPTDGAAGENDEVELAFGRYVPDAAITTLWDHSTAPVVVQGPILVEITATTSLAAGAYVIVEYQTAEV